eukprot:4095404-Prymnesium_polylepis.1
MADEAAARRGRVRPASRGLSRFGAERGAPLRGACLPPDAPPRGTPSAPLAVAATARGSARDTGAHHERSVHSANTRALRDATRERRYAAPLRRARSAPRRTRDAPPPTSARARETHPRALPRGHDSGRAGGCMSASQLMSTSDMVDTVNQAAGSTEAGIADANKRALTQKPDKGGGCALM